MWRTRFLLLLVMLGFNLPTSAQLPVTGCSAGENQVLARYTPPMVQAMLNGNMGLFKALADEANGQLSPSCQTAIMQQQQRQWLQQQQQQRPPTPYGGGGGVIDHGGGAYSNGQVYCGPSGCMGLR